MSSRRRPPRPAAPPRGTPSRRPLTTREWARLRPASLLRRAMARVIDTALFCLTPAALIVVLVLSVVSAFPSEAERRYQRIGDALGDGVLFLIVFISWLIVFVATSFVASYVLEAVIPRRRGQTVGKRLVGLCMITSGAGAPLVPQPRRLALRWFVGHGVPMTALMLIVLGGDQAFGPLPYVMTGAYVCLVHGAALFTERRRGLHDLIAETVVVDAETLPEDHLARCGHKGGLPQERRDLCGSDSVHREGEPEEAAR